MPLGLAVHRDRDRSASLISDPTPATPPSLKVGVKGDVRDLLTLSQRDLDEVLSGFSRSDLRRTIRSLASGDLTDIHCQKALRTALEILAERDPKQFFRWIDNAVLPIGIATSAIEIAAALLAQGDPEESFAILKGLETVSIGQTALKTYGAILAVRDPETAARQLLAARAFFDAGWIVGSSWGARDPAAAADFFGGLRIESLLTMQVGLQQIMLEWVRQDPESARVWASANPDRHVRRMATNYFIRALAGDPDTAEAAFRYISELPTASQRMSLSRSLGHNLAAHGAVDSEFVAKALDIESPFERVEMLASLAGAMPVDIAGEVVATMNGQTFRNKAITNAVRSVPDQKAALRFIQTLESPTDRIAARRVIMSDLSKNKAGEAAQVAFAAEHHRERAWHLKSLAEKLVPDTPNATPPVDVSWIGDLEDSQRQEVKFAVAKWISSRSLEMPEELVDAFE